MKLNQQIKAWNHAFIRIMDVRLMTLRQGERLASYRFPCSVFMYTVEGRVSVRMNDAYLESGAFRLFHGGKGTSLEMLAIEDSAWYMVLYKAELPSHPPEIAAMATNDSPFRAIYEFSPRYPVKLSDRLDGMHRQWNGISELGALQVKATFQQFVHELLWQIRLQEVESAAPDLAAQTATCLRERYREPITLKMIASMLDCSEGHLSRLFKSRYGLSPIQFLIKLRIEQAQALLLQSRMTLQEIAEQVGFPDAHSFSRSFKKQNGLSPSAFRNRNGVEDQKMPTAKSEIALSEQQFPLYNDIENHFHNLKGRERYMQKRNKQLAMVMVLAWSLLLSACSGNGAGDATQPSPSSLATDAGAVETRKPEVTAEPGTRTVSTPRGDVVVPENPQRVASDQYMGHLLKLGIKPVGVKSIMLDEGWFEKAGITEEVLEGIQDLGGVPMDFERLTALEPDLILVSVDKELDQYDKIGTTVFLPYWEGESTAGPLEKFRRISDIFGKRDVAEQWIVEYEAAAADAREKLEGVLKEGDTVSVIQFSEKAVYVMAASGGNYGAPTIYETLKLPAAQSALDMKEGFEMVSLEVLPTFLGDHIFIYNGDKDATKAAMESNVWQTVPAAQKNQVYLYGNAYHDEFLMEDPYSLEQQLETITSILLERQ